jgi:hypothetical protein
VLECASKGKFRKTNSIDHRLPEPKRHGIAQPLGMTGLSHYSSGCGWYQFEESGVDQDGDQ